MKLTREFSRVICSASGENVVISHLGRGDISEAVRFTEMAFGGMDAEILDMVKYLEDEVKVDWGLSLKAMVGGKIVGVYLLRTKGIHEFYKEEGGVTFREDLSRYTDKKGLEGISLVVLPEYRGFGIGNKLKQAALSLGHDYMWGQQLYDLNNLEYWKKNRRHVGDTPDSYVTLQDIER